MIIVSLVVYVWKKIMALKNKAIYFNNYVLFTITWEFVWFRSAGDSLPSQTKSVTLRFLGLLTVSNKQGFKVVESRISLLNYYELSIEFRVKITPFRCLPNSRTGVGSQIGLNFPPLISKPYITEVSFWLV